MRSPVTQFAVKNVGGEIIACNDCPTSCESCTSLTDCASDAMTTLSDWPVQGAKTVIMEQLATAVVWKAAQNAQQNQTVISARIL
jgi:hypothetical protein